MEEFHSEKDVGYSTSSFASAAWSTSPVPAVSSNLIYAGAAAAEEVLDYHRHCALTLPSSSNDLELLDEISNKSCVRHAHESIRDLHSDAGFPA